MKKLPRMHLLSQFKSRVIKCFSKSKKIIGIVFFKGIKRYDLIIYDDIYPHPVSGFRLEEFTCLLTQISSSKILMNPKAYTTIQTDKRLHKNHVNILVRRNRELNGKLRLLKGFVNLNARLFYCVFLNNIFDNLNQLERLEIPFVFTLYPGGGFRLNNFESDKKLRRVLLSPMFRKIIVTQDITKNYLIQNSMCSEDRILQIFGCVVPQNSMKKTIEREYFSIEKDTLDICFCAGKYMKNGLDKGFDVFIELAKLLTLDYSFINFHIIGGFSNEDMDVTVIESKTTFHGYKKFEELGDIFNRMDIIVSPNRSFVLSEGSFDGFPLGTSIEAALNGVLLIVSDDLNQNNYFVNNRDIIITDSDSNKIKREIDYLIEMPHLIKEIGSNGRAKFQNIYSNSTQMKPRIDLLKKELEIRYD